MHKPRRCRVFQVNAFSRELAGGNPAGVVLDADGLTDAQMRRIADGSAAPDTAFVCAPTGSDHDMLVRFLTPRREAVFIGHATLAAQYVCAKLGLSRARKLRQLTGMGIVDVDILEAHDDYRVAITQPAPALGPLFPEQHLDAVLAALGLNRDSLHPEYPRQQVAEKAPRLLLGVRSREALSALRPDFAELKRLSPLVGVEGYFVFALEGGSTASTHARLFCPAMGIPEDPVSGNTHAMLAVYLLQHGLLKDVGNIARFRAHQGAWMGRSGIIDIEAICRDGAPQAVRILGDAVITEETTVTVED